MDFLFYLILWLQNIATFDRFERQTISRKIAWILWYIPAVSLLAILWTLIGSAAIVFGIVVLIRRWLHRDR